MKRIGHLMVILMLLSSDLAHASAFDSSRKPCQTGIPAPLRKPQDIVPLGCDRPFTFRGETYSADSAQAKDASTLKYFVESVPESYSILEEYQSNRAKSKISAYTGTLGLLMLILANPISKQFSSASQDGVRRALRAGGLSIAVGSFFFSYTLIQTNEKLIPEAVQNYNKAKPDDKIELQFSTGWNF